MTALSALRSGARRWLARPGARRRVLGVGLALALGPPAALWGASFAYDVPAGLVRGAGDAATAAPDKNSIRVVDRNGTLLFEARDEAGKRQRYLPLAELGERVPRAIVAAEDSRFWAHPGVDPLALGRAAGDSLVHGRVTSGASTLTQQLARIALGAPRTVKGKLDVISTALAIERAMTKEQILEAYLNRAPFGPNVEGVEAAAQLYFGKPARSLSLGEAATLAAIPRGPALYDPTKRPELVLRRRDRVLDRMLDHGLATADEVRLAKGEALAVSPRFRTGDALQFSRAVLAGRLDPCAPAAPPPAGTVELVTTIDADLQREIAVAAQRVVGDLADRGVSAASVIVIDNRSGGVLAWIGSPDPSDAERLGQNDGVRARRQPGSALKPFLYELAFERGMTPATTLPDVALSFPTASGDPYRPENYDHKFHGPVRIRQALGNSYNVPAVVVADRIGPADLLARLRALGMCSLAEAPDRYGLGLALGDGEITLFELARAYSALARGGSLPAVHGVARWVLADGSSTAFVPPAPEPVLAEDSVALITDILADRGARTASFGEATVFDLPYAVAAKTGTSKGFRDNLAVGYTNEVTVGVWVGNFDGSPMRDVSGITGAGPLFREAMQAAARRFPPTPFAAPTHASERDVCPLSGGRPGAACRHEVKEWIPDGVTLAPCDMHEQVFVDAESGLLSGARCAGAVQRSFERFPPVLRAWAVAAARPLAPEKAVAGCGVAGRDEPSEVWVAYPEDGARFYVDGARGAHVVLRGVFPDQGGELRLDGKPLAVDPRGAAVVSLSPGRHSLLAAHGDKTSAPIHFTVE